MNQSRDPRPIIDRRRLCAALDAVAEDSADAANDPRVVAVLKAALAQGRAEVEARFRRAGDGRAAARDLATLMDQLLRSLYDFATLKVYRTANPSAAERLAVVAVGGYGRAELAPFSDLDLLFLFPYKRTPHAEQLAEYVLYRLWDLGLKVGHATRSIDDCLHQAKADLTIRTSILEARYVAGEQALVHDLLHRFAREVVAGGGPAFIEAKLDERSKRHERTGNSRYALEPNIKDGKGGLRDLQTLFWIGRYLYQAADTAALVERGLLTAEEAATFDKAAAFLWALRFQLHYLAGRAEERLNFDLQAPIAAALRYHDRAGARGVERLMKHYFIIARSVGDLTHIFLSAVEAQHRRRPLFRLANLPFLRREVEGFGVDDDRLTVSGPEVFAADPVALLRLFEVAQRHGLDIHPAALRLVARGRRLVDGRLRADAEANRLFLAMLTSAKDPEATLRRLGEAGIMGRFLPDFGRVMAQMQYDMYHHYTVDEHTLRAIGMLARIERGELIDEVPIASDVVHKVLSRRVLYLAVLLHDIAKGRGGDHSVLGAEVAERLCPRLGLTAEETETVSWLVRWHLLMSDTAFKRDIGDPQTVADFAREVQSLERLRLLLVLTVADIRAVGPKTWNGWKAQLLRDLYYRAEEHLSGGLVAERGEARAAAAVAALKAELGDWNEAAFEAHAARGHAAYWLAFDAKSHARHARLLRQGREAGKAVALDTRIDRWRAIAEITVCAHDRPGLFARLAGAFALSGASIVDARIFTLSDGTALDTFSIQDTEGGAFDRPDRLARLGATIERVLDMDLAALKGELARRRSTLPDRLGVFTVAPRVLIDNAASATHTVVEVNGRDRPGLLFDLTSAVSDLGLQVSSARIATFGARAVDVFYVKDRFGLKIEAEPTLKAIRERLMAALEGTPASAAEPTAAAR
jgi:[protein-PII] uridylyltransferase